MTTAQIVYIANQELCSEVFTASDLLAAMRERGFRLRAELRGQPKFAEIYGPMWGGLTEAGDPIIRYEAPNAYETLSR